MSARASQARAKRARTPAGLRLVRRRSRRLIKRTRSTRMAPVALLMTICVAAVIFGVLLEQVVLAQSAFELSKIRNRLTEVEARHEELVLEAAQLESPDRVRTYARRVLGMVEPSRVEYLTAEVPGAARTRLAGAPRGASIPGEGQASTWVLSPGTSP